MYDEVTAGDGLLVDWIKENKDSFCLSLRPDVGKMRSVMSSGYASDLSDEVQKIGKNPFIVVYALMLIEKVPMRP